MKKTTILITGVGGLGAEILKAIKLIKYPKRIIGTDSSSRAAGLYQADKGYLVPLAKDPKYIPALIDIGTKEKVSIILIGTIQELPILAQYKQKFESLGIKIIVADHSSIRVSQDKYLCIKHLARYNFPVPTTALGSDLKAINRLIKQHKFPVFVKPRHGSGSKDSHIINNRQHLKPFLSNQYVIQQFLGLKEKDEYTTGCYLAQDEKFYFILLKRILLGGITGQAQPCINPSVKKLCFQVVKSLSIYGPCNIQMKIIKNKPIIFEINPRFSSTSSIQARLGTNLVCVALAEYLNWPLPKLSIKNKIALRYFSELFLNPDQEQKLLQNKVI